MRAPLLVPFLALVLAVAGCNKPHPALTEASGVVHFRGSGFSLEPGDGWVLLNTRRLAKDSPDVVVCQPVLDGRLGTIQVVQLGDRISESEAVARVSRAYDADPLADADSLFRDDFQADSGHNLLVFTYSRHAAGEPSRPLNHQTNYVARTRGGRWIAICAQTGGIEETRQVADMVKRTLREIPPVTPTPAPGA